MQSTRAEGIRASELIAGSSLVAVGLGIGAYYLQGYWQELPLGFAFLALGVATAEAIPVIKSLPRTYAYAAIIVLALVTAISLIVLIVWKSDIPSSVWYELLLIVAILPTTVFVAFPLSRSASKFSRVVAVIVPLALMLASTYYSAVTGKDLIEQVTCWLLPDSHSCQSSALPPHH